MSDLHISEPESALDLSARSGLPLSDQWTHRSLVYLGDTWIGTVRRLMDGQWATWRHSPRFATAEEAAEHLRQTLDSERLSGASLSGPLGGAEVTR